MADEQSIPPIPPPGEIVGNGPMLQLQWSQYRNTLAFGGMRNPTAIWSSMVRDEATSILYYRELEEKDDDASGALDGVKLAVLKRDHKVSAGTVVPGSSDTQAEDIAQFIQSQLDGLPNFHNVLDCMLDAYGYGYSIQEQIFDVSEGQVALLDVHDCPQELFLFNRRFTPQIGPLQFLDSPYAAEGTLVPEQKFAVFSSRMRARNRMGRPLLRSVFWLSWFKRQTLRLWLNFGEKGPGTAVVRYADSADPIARQQAVEIAEALIHEVAVGVPESFSYDQELLKIARAQDPAVYKELYNLLQYAIWRKIQGQTLTSFGNEGGTGSRSQGDVHQGTLDSRARELCLAVQSVVNRQIVRPMVLWNYGPNVPMPKWGFDLDEEEDLAKRIEIDKGLQGMGMEIPTNYARQRYSVPAPVDGEEVLRAAPAAPPIQVTPMPKFAEGGHVDTDLDEFDKVMNELRSESLSLYQKRVKEVTDPLAAALAASRDK